jgi:hypothetical protein
MQDFEASDGVVTTNIDTTITATRIGSLRLTSEDTDVASTQIPHMERLETDECKVWLVLKDNMYVLLTIVSAQGCHDNCVTPSAHDHAVLGLPHALQFLDLNLPLDSNHFGQGATGGALAI